MRQGSTLREYFYFTRKERNGILLLLLLSIAVVFFPVKKMVRQPAAEIIDDSLKRQLIALSMQPEPDKDFHSSFHSYRKSGEGGGYRKPEQWATPDAYFYFDPNTLGTEGWRKLGMPDKNIQTLQHYLEKGGKFRQPGDLRKIWGIPTERAEQLIPYVKIDPGSLPQANAGTSASKPALGKPYRMPASIDVNRADTTEWISLPGIGSRLASRIVAFRDKLGGFVSINQVAETFGLSDSTFQMVRSRLVCNNPDIRRININRATVEELRVHPYIRYPIAGAIIQYRKQHGEFAAVDDLRKLVMVTPEIFTRISPYLSVGE